jgi:hypothetical protein
MACAYRVTCECSGQDVCMVRVYHGKQSTSLHDVQRLTELRVIWVVAADLGKQIGEPHGLILIRR